MIYNIYICFQQPNTEIQTHLISTQGDSAEMYLGDVPQQELGKWPQPEGHLQCLLHPLKPLDPDIFSCWCMEMLLISKVKRPQTTTRNGVNKLGGQMKQLRNPHIWFKIILQTWPRVLLISLSYVIYTPTVKWHAAVGVATNSELTVSCRGVTVASWWFLHLFPVQTCETNIPTY